MKLFLNLVCLTMAFRSALGKSYGLVMHSYFILNGLAMLFILFITAIPGQNMYWRIGRTFIHFMLTGGASVCIIFTVLTEWADLSDGGYYGLKEQGALPMFYFNVCLTIFHCLLGPIVLCSKEFCARLFNPLISPLIEGLRKLGSCCCSATCQAEIEGKFHDQGDAKWIVTS
jgi:hypothetical protein